MAFKFELSRAKAHGADCWVLRDPDEDRTLYVSSEPWTDDDGLEWASKQVRAMVGWTVRWVANGDRWTAERVA